MEKRCVTTGVHLLKDLSPAERRRPVKRASASVSSGTVSKFIAHRARFNVLFKSGGAARTGDLSSGTINSRGETVQGNGMQRE